MRNRVKDSGTMLSCWGNVVAMKHVSNKRAQMPPSQWPYRFSVTDYESLGCDSDKKVDARYSYKHILQSYNTDAIYRDYTASDISSANRIFRLILEDWMYGYKRIYTRSHYKPLLLRILKLVGNKKPLKFLLPGFSAKSSNKDEKVFGVHPDFAEFLGLRTLVETVRKIQEIYPNDVIITIMADTQTIDTCDEICQEDCDLYNNDLKEMIRLSGADDVIKLFSSEEQQDFERSDTTNEYIRISVHHHHPITENFPIDLYKNHNCNKGVLRTPWRSVILFDSMQGGFLVGHKKHLLGDSQPKSPVLTVTYNNYDWLLLMVQYSEITDGTYPSTKDIEVSLLRYGKGLLIENKSANKYDSSLFHLDCMKSMIKEFGVVILRGFDRSNNVNEEEEEMNDYFSSRGSLDLVCVLQMNSNEPIVIEYVRLRLEPGLISHQVCWE